MKSVLMIAYSFPPEGNAGAHRPLRFVRHLPSNGWNPTVITHETELHERYDRSLLACIPPNIDVISIPNGDPWLTFKNRRALNIQRKMSVLPIEKVERIRVAQQTPFRSFARQVIQTAEAWCYHPDTEMGWIRPAINAALKICKQAQPQRIWATAGPVSSFVVAQKVAESTGVPYVLDFRDAWTITYNDFEDRRPIWAKRREERRMYRLLKLAQSVIFRFRVEAECYWRAYKDALEASKVYIIPNGYDGKIDKFVPPEGDKCEVLYTGTLSDYRYDSLLQSLVVLKRSAPNLAKRLLFHFVGEGTEAVARHAATLDLSDTITTRGPTSQEEIARLSQRAHALLILGRPSTMRGYELFAAAKLFGYLKAGMPIIGVLPDDETKKVLFQIGVTTVADVDSQSEIVDLLRGLLEAWSQGNLSSLSPKPAACEIYSAERQTEELVRALQGAPALEPFLPGSVEVPNSLRSQISKIARHFEPRTLRPLYLSDGNRNSDIPPLRHGGRGEESS